MYDDENGISFPLTPSDLLCGRRIAQNPNILHFDVVSTSKALTHQAKQHFRLLAGFNKQWSREYLLSLRECHRVRLSNGIASIPIAVGHIVLIRNKGTARCFWKLAKVIELIPGQNNVVRAAWVEVATDKRPMKLRRPLQMLTPLEITV